MEDSVVSPAAGRTRTGSGGGSGPSSGVTDGSAAPARVGGLGCDVDADRVEGGGGDPLGAVQDGLDRGAADEAEQAADHAAGAAVQVLFEPGQGAGLVAVQAQAVFQGGDQRGPVLAAGERGGPDHAEAPGDLLAAGAGQEPVALDVDAGVDEGSGDPLGEVLEHVGGFRAGPGGEADVVDLVDGDQAGAGVGADPADGLGDVGQVRPADDGQAEEPGELDGDHLRGRGGRGGDVDDRDLTAGAGAALAVDDFEGLAELGDRGGLAGAGRPGQDRISPRRALVAWRLREDRDRERVGEGK